MSELIDARGRIRAAVGVAFGRSALLALFREILLAPIDGTG
jgi:hypothetical protein